MNHGKLRNGITVLFSSFFAVSLLCMLVRERAVDCAPGYGDITAPVELIEFIDPWEFTIHGDEHVGDTTDGEWFLSRGGILEAYEPPPEWTVVSSGKTACPTGNELRIATEEIEIASREVKIALDVGIPVSATTDASGVYTFKNLSAGEYIVWASLNGYTTEYYKDGENRFDARRVPVTAGITTGDITFSLETESSSRISSSVTPDPSNGAGTVTESNALRSSFISRSTATGGITGMVRAASSGTPIKGVTVYAQLVERATVSPGDAAVILYEIHPATKTVIIEGGTATASVEILPDRVDTYVAARDPWGTLYFLTPTSGADKRFFTYPVPYVSNTPITRFYGVVGAFLVNSRNPEGTWRFYAVMVPPGARVLEPDNWLSNLAFVNLELEY